LHNCQHTTPTRGSQKCRGWPEELAGSDRAYSRGLQKRDELFASGVTEAELQQLGAEKIAAAQRGDPLDSPPLEVKPRDKAGKEGDPLTVEEASRRLTAWREEQAAQREAELAEHAVEREQQQQDEFERLQAQQQPEPPQPDPVQQERQHVIQERQRTEAIKQLSFIEVAGLNSLTQLDQQVRQAFPELANVRSEQDLHNLHAQLQALHAPRHSCRRIRLSGKSRLPSHI
jgi:hypothetical protein